MLRVGHNAQPDAQQQPSECHCCFDVDDMPSTVKSQHIFLTVCHPLDGLSQGHGEVGDGSVFWEDAALLAKATPTSGL